MWGWGSKDEDNAIAETQRLSFANAPIRTDGFPTAEVVDTSDIFVTNDNDKPKFKRKYTLHLEGQFKHFKIQLNREHATYGGGREGYGMLTQPDGKWVLFDVNRIAHDILNQDLVPFVQDAASRMVAMDREYMATCPVEFTDSQGVTWIRKDALLNVTE